VEYLQILGATIHTLVAGASWRLELVSRWT